MNKSIGKYLSLFALSGITTPGVNMTSLGSFMPPSDKCKQLEQEARWVYREAQCYGVMWHAPSDI